MSEPKKRKKLIAVIVIIVAAAVVVIAVVAMWFHSRNVNAEPEETETVTEEIEPYEEAAPETEVMEEEEAPEVETSESEETGTYVLPDSDTRLYTADELAGLSKADLRIARNEIYARHGRRFDSQDLQDYFDSQPWYHGTIDPDDFDSGAFNDIEKKNIALIEEAEDDSTELVTGTISGTETDTSDSVFEASWQVIRDYGFDFDQGLNFGGYYDDEWQYSLLSFTLVGGTAVDDGEYYTVQAVFNKPLKVPAYPEPGDTFTAAVNELTGEEETFTYVREEGTGAEYYRKPGGEECWITNIGSDGMAELMEGSDDRIDVPFYQGVLRIRKDAVTGAAVLRGPYVTVTASDFADDDWFNAVAFDGDGYVTQLIFVGD